MGTTGNVPELIPVSWAFIVAVDYNGRPEIVDLDYVTDIKASRMATLDDINAAAFILGQRSLLELEEVEEIKDGYRLAFLVFQVPEGFIAASPNIFENLAPSGYAYSVTKKGAFGVLQNQITAERAANLASQVAVSATLSFLKNEAQKAMDPEADKKSKGGLIVV